MSETVLYSKAVTLYDRKVPIEVWNTMLTFSASDNSSLVYSTNRWRVRTRASYGGRRSSLLEIVLCRLRIFLE